MVEYHLDWRLKLFCILWVIIVIILTILSIIWTRKYVIQMRRRNARGAKELFKTCHLLQIGESLEIDLESQSKRPYYCKPPFSWS